MSEHPSVEAARPPGSAFWDERRWEPVAPLAGILAVALVIAGVLTFESADTPDEDSTPLQVLAYFNDEQTSIFLGSFLFALGLLFFLWFVGSIRARIAAAEGASRLAALALAGATGMTALLLGALGMSVSGAIALDSDVRLTPQAAQALWVASDGLFFFAWFMAALFLAATGVGALRTRLLPAWLGWVTLAMAVLLLVPWVGWAVFIFALPVWIIVVSILLWRSPATGVHAGPAVD